jgi:hypothetical protein
MNNENKMNKILEYVKLMQEYAKLQHKPDKYQEEICTDLLILVLDVINIRNNNGETFLSYTITNTEKESRIAIGTGFTELSFKSRDKFDKSIKKLIKSNEDNYKP